MRDGLQCSAVQCGAVQVQYEGMGAVWFSVWSETWLGKWGLRIGLVVNGGHAKRDSPFHLAAGKCVWFELGPRCAGKAENLGLDRVNQCRTSSLGMDGCRDVVAEMHSAAPQRRFERVNARSGF